MYVTDWQLFHGCFQKKTSRKKVAKYWRLRVWERSTTWWISTEDDLENYKRAHLKTFRRLITTYMYSGCKLKVKSLSLTHAHTELEQTNVTSSVPRTTFQPNSIEEKKSKSRLLLFAERRRSCWRRARKLSRLRLGCNSTTSLRRQHCAPAATSRYSCADENRFIRM